MAEDGREVTIETKPCGWHLSLLSAALFLFAAFFLAGTSRVRSAARFVEAGGGSGLRELIAQEGPEEEEEVSPDQVEKYVAVYKAMQHNHDLNVEQAAAMNGISVEAFRDIERRVERDDLVRERVRQALRAGAQTSGNPPAGAASPTPAK